jgi:hypothetical protein
MNAELEKPETEPKRERYDIREHMSLGGPIKISDPHLDIAIRYRMSVEGYDLDDMEGWILDFVQSAVAQEDPQGRFE